VACLAAGEAGLGGRAGREGGQQEVRRDPACTAASGVDRDRDFRLFDN
jgi:hypothetical protein